MPVRWPCSTTRTCSPPRASSRPPTGTSCKPRRRHSPSDGVAGLCVGPELPRVGAFIYQAGGGIYNDDATELTITSPESVAGIDLFLQIHEAESLQTPADLGAGWCGEAFGQSKAAMTMEGTWLFPPLENDFPDVNFDVVELPQGVEQGNLTFTNAYGMGVDSANKEAGWVLLQYLAGPEGMGKWTASGSRSRRAEDVPAPPDREAHRRRPRVRNGLRLRTELR